MNNKKSAAFMQPSSVDEETPRNNYLPLASSSNENEDQAAWEVKKRRFFLF